MSAPKLFPVYVARDDLSVGCGHQHRLPLAATNCARNHMKQHREVQFMEVTRVRPLAKSMAGTVGEVIERRVRRIERGEL